jgi:hypothetical protein
VQGGLVKKVVERVDAGSGLCHGLGNYWNKYREILSNTVILVGDKGKNYKNR